MIYDDLDDFFFLIFFQEDSKIVSEQIEKELAEKQEAIVRESIRANKNKMRDQYMSAHLDGLRNHRVWE